MDRRLALQHETSSLARFVKTRNRATHSVHVKFVDLAQFQSGPNHARYLDGQFLDFASTLAIYLLSVQQTLQSKLEHTYKPWARER
jgi:hypothetical protein